MQSEVKVFVFGDSILIRTNFNVVDSVEQYFIESSVVPMFQELAEEINLILEESRGIKVC